MSRAAVLIIPVLLLSSCAAPQPWPVSDYGPPARETLYTPAVVKPGRLEYAPDRSTFAPILTERFPYPTQPEANAAYQRLHAGDAADGTPSSVWLFGCKPGALDAQTARVTRYRGPVVHCATDFLDTSGRRLRREAVNFYYHGDVWNMQPIDPPRSAVPWRNRERSPTDFWKWWPGRDRYE
ncbi:MULTISPECIES: hypothetical protein [Hyphomicrobiales]|uniref:hypothetical protein n=1 Tax=Hyphomicrobiales TaxID=356 RepID=UPI0003DEFA4D|nr:MULTISPECIES: hypothetical protein [Hyphomicrobiales]CAH1662922.1 conserved exported hypothetical protein [Hyphomicrobiales bacterium]ETR79420.1 hypothetical protein X566_00450 [Afipia sp. P52-10]MBS7743595.1 hypothetical protein [Chelatococcus sp. HY11]MBX3546502.1 hypothetical protein [Chelatococcus sp.]MCO5079781.1 hypothetical protein [Chelatococcus sp.]